MGSFKCEFHTKGLRREWGALHFSNMGKTELVSLQKGLEKIEDSNTNGML
jgi:hypothetical protein